ncbi:MAG: homoaconitase [bacterium]|nr:homoaconitase [bacterium]
MAQNLVEKIAQKYAVQLAPDHEVRSGDFLSIRPAHVMTHDNTGAVIPKFRSIGATRVDNPRQPVYALDHDIQNTGEKNLAKYEGIKNFAAEMGVDFYPAGRGIGHQIMCEEGYAWPGAMMVASDSHSNMYGGLGCLGTPIVRTDAAAIWATGRTWWQVPPVARVKLTGKLRPWVTGKDVILTLTGHFNNDELLNHAIEFAGEGVAELSIDQRLAVANMTTEWGALAGVFPIDRITLDWLRRRIDTIAARGLEGVPSDADGEKGAHPRMNAAHLAELEADLPVADADAYYAKEVTLDLGSVQPMVAGPHNLKTVATATEFDERDIKIHKAYLLSCVNSRVEDISQAASVVKGRKIAPGVDFLVAAASREVQAAAEASGDWQTLLDAGARTIPPSCGPCIGMGTGLLDAGEVGISATNRNFKGRMGSPESEAFLGSPAVVAASALAGKITLPEGLSFDREAVLTTISVNPAPDGGAAEVTILDGFPEKMEGELLFVHEDNLNTDGIYPGKYTYQDDMTPEQQAEVAMENYDPEFQSIAQRGDLLVGAFNFGTGSSREQAATALKHRGIGLVMAGSFSETYKRNALNNGFLVIDAPELARDLRERFGTDKLTVRTGLQSTLDFRTATLTVNGKPYSLAPVGPAAQELVLEGGLESWVKNRL